MEAMRATSERQGGAHVPQSDHHHPAAAEEPADQELQELLGETADDSAEALPASSRPAPPAVEQSPEEILAQLRSTGPSIVTVDPKAATAVQPGAMSSLATV